MRQWNIGLESIGLEVSMYHLESIGLGGSLTGF